VVTRTDPTRHQHRRPVEIRTQEPTGNAAMDPITILLISLTTLVAANLATSRSKA